MFCSNCGYNLHGLTEHRCPECARPFDPTDPRTYRLTPRRIPHRGAVLLAYLLPGLLCLQCWATADSRRWSGYGYGMPLSSRMLVGLCQVSGPAAAWMMTGQKSRILPIIVAPSVWAVWLTAVLVTPLRRMPLIVHFGLALGWCFLGCGPTGLVIT